MKKKKIKGALLFTLSLSVLFLAAFIMNIKKNNKAINIFGNYISVVISESMEPTIMTDDIIIYSKADTYNIDDIIVFQINDFLVVHRIVQKTDDGYITKGDNNERDDFYRYGYIKDSQVVGKVKKSMYLLGLGKLLH